MVLISYEASTRIQNGANSAPRKTVISHYDVLNVCSTATTATIKDAYHTLIKQYHPDKQMNRCNDNTIDTDISDNSYHSGMNSSNRDFVQIQTAWECLRDPTSRWSYDDQLHKQQEQYKLRRRQRQQNSIPITRDECRQERQFIEINEDDNDDHECPGVNRIVVVDVVEYIYQCRCGHDLYVAQQQSHASSESETEQQLPQLLLLFPKETATTTGILGEDGSLDNSDDMFVHCVGCSVVYDIRPVFQNEPDDTR